MTRACLSAALAATALLAAACGPFDEPSARSSAREGKAAAEPAPRVSARPALCGRLRAGVTGRVATPAATELSGLTASRTQRRVLWSHNDSGDTPRILAFTPSGRPLAEPALTGAEHVDWEDMAIGPLPGPGDALLVADIGDNAATRPAVTVYRVREPRLVAGAPGPLPAERMTLRYPDGAHDAEALLVDPVGGALVIVTKDFRGAAGIYLTRRFVRGAVVTLRAAGRIPLGPVQAVTAGDVSAGGRTVVLRSYDRAFVFSRLRGRSLASALRRRPCVADVSLIPEGQGETLALGPGSRAFYTVPEGPRPVLRRYAPAR